MRLFGCGRSRSARAAVEARCLLAGNRLELNSFPSLPFPPNAFADFLSHSPSFFVFLVSSRNRYRHPLPHRSHPFPSNFPYVLPHSSARTPPSLLPLPYAPHVSPSTLADLPSSVSSFSFSFHPTVPPSVKDHTKWNFLPASPPPEVPYSLTDKTDAVRVLAAGNALVAMVRFQTSTLSPSYTSHPFHWKRSRFSSHFTSSSLRRGTRTDSPFFSPSPLRITVPHRSHRHASRTGVGSSNRGEGAEVDG